MNELKELKLLKDINFTSLEKIDQGLKLIKEGICEIVSEKCQCNNENDWIPIEKELPIKYNFEDLEVTMSDGQRNVGFYRVEDGQWYENTTYKELEVIAWKKPSSPYIPKKD